MDIRPFGNTGIPVSAIGLGTWQLGAEWGDVDDERSVGIINEAVSCGVTFIDTADVYGDGRSERTIGRRTPHFSSDGLFVATKMGRRVAQDPANYTPEAFAAWNQRSRANLGVDCVDLVQLHCPPTAVLADARTWDELQRMVDRGVIAHYGASVETCEQAHIAMDHGAQSIQIILNVFRRKPLESVVSEAKDRGVAIIARVPLASGLLSGKYAADTIFADNDHRSFNRHGEAFDVGETFAGVPYEVGVEAAAEFSRLCEEFGPVEATPAQVALKWIIEQPGVTTVIPGARTVEQARHNANAARLPALSADLHAALEDLYDRKIRTHVHNRW